MPTMYIRGITIKILLLLLTFIINIITLITNKNGAVNHNYFIM